MSGMLGFGEWVEWPLHYRPWHSTLSSGFPPADKSGTLDFGEWVEWWLQKKRGYAWQEGGQTPST